MHYTRKGDTDAAEKAATCIGEGEPEPEQPEQASSQLLLEGQPRQVSKQPAEMPGPAEQQLQGQPEQLSTQLTQLPDSAEQQPQAQPEQPAGPLVEAQAEQPSSQPAGAIGSAEQQQQTQADGSAPQPEQLSEQVMEPQGAAEPLQVQLAGQAAGQLAPEEPSSHLVEKLQHSSQQQQPEVTQQQASEMPQPAVSQPPEPEELQQSQAQLQEHSSQPAELQQAEVQVTSAAEPASEQPSRQLPQAFMQQLQAVEQSAAGSQAKQPAGQLAFCSAAEQPHTALVTQPEQRPAAPADPLQSQSEQSGQYIAASAGPLSLAQQGPSPAQPGWLVNAAAAAWSVFRPGLPRQQVQVSHALKISTHVCWAC